MKDIVMTPLNTPYAGGWQRTGAMVLDMIIGMIFGHVIRLVGLDLLVQSILSIIVNALYFILLEGSARHASLGKRMLGLTLGTKSGEPITMRTIVLRYAITLVPSLPMYFVMFSSGSILQDLALHQDDTTYIDQLFAQPEILNFFMVFGLCALFFVATSIILFWLPIFFTKEKIGLHDWLLKTRVYKKLPEVTAIAP